MQEGALLPRRCSAEQGQRALRTEPGWSGAFGSPVVAEARAYGSWLPLRAAGLWSGGRRRLPHWPMSRRVPGAVDSVAFRAEVCPGSVRHLCLVHSSYVLLHATLRLVFQSPFSCRSTGAKRLVLSLECLAPCLSAVQGRSQRAPSAALLAPLTANQHRPRPGLGFL